MRISQLWNDLNSEIYSKFSEIDLKTFRGPESKFNRCSYWAPKDNTYRYYLTMLYNYTASRNEEFFERYTRIGNTELGRPLTVCVKGVNVNLDYALSLEEFDVLNREIDVKSIRSIVEIGAGFGRTPHCLLMLLPKVEHYTVVDLCAMLRVSEKYLASVLPSNMFSKIAFVDAEETSAWRDKSSDTALNINSFQEMPVETIQSYLSSVFGHAELAYTKNPIGKYPPSLVGIKDIRAHDVFSLGLMQDEVNIYDESALVKARIKFETAYKPTKSSKLLGLEPSEIFGYFQHCVYKVGA